MVKNKQCRIVPIFMLTFGVWSCSPLRAMVGRGAQAYVEKAQAYAQHGEAKGRPLNIDIRSPKTDLNQVAAAGERITGKTGSPFLDTLAQISTNGDLDRSQFSKTKLLKDKDKTREEMIKSGCISVDFSACDGKKINGLLRYHPDAQANVVVLVGWNPGRVEGAAILLDMLPREQYNILFVNVRYHGRSEGGSLWWHLPDLGVHEHKDVIAALQFLRYQTRHISVLNGACDTTQKPNFIYGICAGAFHALNAVKDLTKDEIDRLGLKGIIVDGAWAKVSEVVKETGLAMGPKNACARSTGLLAKLILFDGSFKWYESQTCLYGKLSNLQVPVCFFHAINDERARIEHVGVLVKELATAKKEPALCLFDGNCHGTLYLKYKYLFRNALLNFFESQMSVQK